MDKSVSHSGFSFPLTSEMDQPDYVISKSLTDLCSLGFATCFYLGLGSSRVFYFYGHTALAGYNTQLHFSFSILLNIRGTALPCCGSGPPPSLTSPILWLHLSHSGPGHLCSPGSLSALFALPFNTLFLTDTVHIHSSQYFVICC